MTDEGLAIWNHRPSMTYEGLKLVFNDVGDLVISEEESGTTVTIPDWQLDLVLAYIKRHRLSGVQAALSRRGTKEPQASGSDEEQTI